MGEITRFKVGVVQASERPKAYSRWTGCGALPELAVRRGLRCLWYYLATGLLRRIRIVQGPV